jgi:hypothetical protein
MCQTSYVVAGSFLPGRHLLFFLLQSPLLLLERHMLQRGLPSNTLAPPPHLDATAVARPPEVANSAQLQRSANVSAPH